MLVSNIFVYPVKSLKSTELASVIVKKRGFENDRRYMIIDDTNNFVTQRQYPELGEIEVFLKNKRINFINRITNSSISQKTELSDKKISVSIWNSICNASLLKSTLFDDWISAFCKAPLKLVYMADEDLRLVNQKYGKPNDIVSFADGYPVLITNTASLDALNQKLIDPVGMERFRPNLVINGKNAWEEDNWKNIKIGEVILRVVKPCARCIVITIDQKTGQQGKEPLFTLSKFRKENNKVLFGMNAIVEKGGRINRNDKVEIIE